MPSPYESLSIVLLEAWKLGPPVLANGRCRVLVGQCLRSGGGLFYDGYAEFRESGPRCCWPAATCGRPSAAQGREYVEREYSWEQVDARMEAFLARLSPAPGVG